MPVDATRDTMRDMPLTVLALVLVVAHSSDGAPSLLNDSARSTSSSNDLTDQVSDRDPAQDVALAAAVGAVIFGAGSALALSLIHI